jgi:hypothetical protein
MANYRKMAIAALLADGQIDAKEVAIIKKNLMADNKISNDEVEFLVELRTKAHSAAKKAKKSVNPKFEQLFYKLVSKNIQADKKIDATEAATLKRILSKKSPSDKKFLAKLKKETSNVAAEFTALCTEFGVK